MANDRSGTGASGGFIAWLDGLLASLVSGEDLRVRNVIASAVTHARSNHDAERTRWYARHDQSMKMRAE